MQSMSPEFGKAAERSSVVPKTHDTKVYTPVHMSSRASH